MTPSQQVLAQVTAILFFKMWLAGTTTTYVRGRVMASPNAEDEWVMTFFNRVFRVPTQPLVHLVDAHESDASVSRWSRIGSNDAANIPISLLVFFIACVYETLGEGVFVPLVWTFAVARVAHTVCYAFALQPWRTVAYSVASITVAVAAVSLVLG